MADRTPRFPFLASAEVASDDSVEVTRVTELSRHGCYLETTKHRTAGTRVIVKITNKDQIFEATATVLYSRPMMGMAVAFREVKPLFRSMLKDWLQESLNQQNQKPSIDNLKLSKSIPSGQKMRRSPRIPFIAVAQIAYESDGRLSCQVATLSLHGCYVETPITLPPGRKVSIKIFAESEWFAANAKIVYELPNSAMGLAFEDVSLKSVEILRQWLLKASGGP
ncbi:MAG: PilZ domain, partial [Acidobacteriaceae bacterium]|nr:PilZ domain [Acidobacteriaceae bacterium]